MTELSKGALFVNTRKKTENQPNFRGDNRRSNIAKIRLRNFILPFNPMFGPEGVHHFNHVC